MKLLRLYFRRSPGLAVLAIVAGGLSGGATAWLLSIINTVLTGPAWSSHLVAAFVGLCLLRLVSGIVSHLLLIRLSQTAILHLRLELCDHILRAPLRFIESLGPHRLTACFTDDVANVSNIVINIPYFLINLVVLAACLTYLASLSMPAFAAVVSGLLIGVATYLGPVLWANRHFRLAREQQDALFAHFRSVTEGTKELKLHAGRRQRFTDALLRAAARRLHHHNVAGISIYASAANWNRLLFFVYVGLLLFALPMLTPVTPAAMATWILVVLYMMAPLEAIMNTLPHLDKANVSLGRIDAVGQSLAHAAEAAAQAPPAPPLTSPAAFTSITIRAVTHQYHSPHEQHGFTLGPLHTSFYPGEIVYLIGGNGGGKTTFAKILTGLYPPEAGSLLLDDRPVTELTREQYRQLFSAVFADFHLFDRLLTTDDPAAHAPLLRDVRLDRHVSLDAAGRFSTTALSQGQRRRLALLTALAEDRPFYVFDECASDQDPAFKQLFYEQIVPGLRMRGKAVLVITHDDRYLHLADRVLKLDAGQLTTVSPGKLAAVTASR